MARTLISMEIPDCLDAPALFGRQGNGGLLVARPNNNWAVPYCSVPEGFYALVTVNGREEFYKDSKGNESPVWPSGFFFAGPFTKVSHLVTKQTIIFDAPVKGCKTSDNVTVQIDVSVAFRVMGDEMEGEDPELVRNFVHRVSPAGLESQLKDALAESIRTLARSLKHTEVYACRTGVGAAFAVVQVPREEEEDTFVPPTSKSNGIEMTKSAKVVPIAPASASAPSSSMDEDEMASARGIDVTQEMKDKLNAQFEPQGIQIRDVMIQDVVLPIDIVNQMSNKSLVRSKQEYEMMEQQFEMQAITLKNEAFARQIDHKEEQEKAEVEGARDVQLARDKYFERIAVRERQISDFKEHSRQEISKLEAETEENCITLEFEKRRAYQLLKLEAEEEAANIIATADAKVRETAAGAELEVTKCNANAQIIMSEAEAKADELLSSARELELIDARLGVYESLVKNKDVVISGSSDASLNSLLLSDSVLAGQTRGKSHDSLLAELNVLRLASAAYGLEKATYIPDSDQKVSGTLGSGVLGGLVR
jgi:regulator of protease activity HflC (stomatin/prohibitin superfamily)